MDYKMNLGNELAQIKNCKTQEEMIDFVKQHNLDPIYFAFSWDKENRTITFEATWTNGRSKVNVNVTVE